MKVVRRLAVRIEIAMMPIARTSLFSGLSANVKVDTHDQKGAPLADEDTPALSATRTLQRRRGRVRIRQT